MRREVKSAFVLVGVLLTTLVVLGILQYFWIGDVAEAERQRMQNSLQLATSRFAEEFNGEVMRALMTTSAGQRMQAIDDGNYGQLYLQWRATAAYPAMIKSVFVVDNSDREDPRLLEFEDKSGVLKNAEWPNELRDVEQQLREEYETFTSPLDEPFAPQPRRNMFLARDPPVAVLPMAQFVQTGPRPAFPWPPFGGPPAKWVIVVFDQDVLAKEVFPELTARYFLPLGEGEYRLVVMTTTAPRRVVYQSSVEEGDFSNADSKADLFSPPGGLNRPAAGRAGPFNLAARRSGHWELLVEHRLGSLDAAANRLYRRNMAVSFGTLIVLLGSVIMIILVSERARALANQQIKFAAGVSHELRTPLAAIQALTHNLAVGVIKNPADVQQYARMVHDEARGLTGIVDQVLLFGETRSMLKKRKKYENNPVEIVEIIEDAIAALTPEIHESGCDVTSEVPEDAPTVRATATVLTHCVRNLISNALKYGTRSPSRNSIRIVVSHNEPEREVCIAIVDQGSGIDPADSPHIFEAFYRGRDTTSGKRGAGLGLYLVKQLIEAMGGKITVESLAGIGSTFTLHVPIFAQEHPSGTSHLHR